MRKLLWLAALATLFFAPTGSRQVAAWPSQGRLEQAAELSAPAHRAPEAPRLQSDLERGQGGARQDRATGGVLPDQVPALAVRYSSLADPVLVRRSGAEGTIRGTPLFPTGPPSTVS